MTIKSFLSVIILECLKGDQNPYLIIYENFDLRTNDETLLYMIEASPIIGYMFELTASIM